MAKFSPLLLCFTLLLCLLVGSSVADPAIGDTEFSGLEKRQDNNSTLSNTSSSSSVVTLPTSRSSALSQTPPSSSPSPPPTPTSSTSTTPITPPPQTSNSNSLPPPPPPSPSTSDTPVETPTPTTPTTPTTPRIITTTISTDGTVVTTTIVSSQTTVETPVGTAGQESGGDNSGGLTPTTRNTIIGVVVGVGGALLFGGLVIVAWRLKRRNKNPVDEDDLMRRDGSPLAAGRDMHATSPEQSPFKATLDQYHKPPGVVNASSNF